LASWLFFEGGPLRLHLQATPGKIKDQPGAGDPRPNVIPLNPGTALLSQPRSGGRRALWQALFSYQRQIPAPGFEMGQISRRAGEFPAGHRAWARRSRKCSTPEVKLTTKCWAVVEGEDAPGMFLGEGRRPAGRGTLHCRWPPPHARCAACRLRVAPYHGPSSVASSCPGGTLLAWPTSVGIKTPPRAPSSPFAPDRFRLAR